MQKLSMGISEWILLITLSVLWGGSFFLIKIALRDLPPLTVVLCRVSLAAIVLTIFVFISRKRMPASLSLWREFLVMGALNNLIPFSLIVWGQTQINSSLAAILNATTPLFTILLAHFFTKDERLTPNRLVGVFLGLCGVIVLIGLDTLHGLSLNSLGQLAILGAACFYGCAGIYGRRFKTLPATVTAAGMLTSTTVLVLPLVLLVDRPWILHLSTVTKLAVLGLSLFSTAIAYLIYFRILAVAGASNLLLVTFLIPVSALVLGIFVLGEQLPWTEFGGMVLIFASLAVIDGRLISRLWHPTSEI
ncbi:DMT family transporter [Chlorogloeopsis sp. ULAP02]|uniref:DMT family transporter n=1 Tax=Chlorogloeopsis sp. ULAP02 TaxID=3107926 RepID=UPI0031369483